MKIKLFIFFIIILILSFFSIRNLNYDDYLYVLGIEISNGNMNYQYPFLGEIHTGLHGTHSIVSFLFYYLPYRFSSSIILLHFLVYILYASLIFPISKILHYYNIKRADIASFLFLLIPSIILNANTLMMDIPPFIFFIWGFYFLIYSNNKKRFLLSLLLFTIAFLLKYIYVFSIVLIPLFSKDNKRKKAFISFMVFSLLYLLLYITQNTPSVFQVIKWTGSTTLFNFHKIIDKIQSYALLIGLSSIYILINKKTYKNPIFYVALSLGVMFAFVLKDMAFLSRIIFAILSSVGIFSLYNIFYASEDNKSMFFWFSLYSVFAIFFMPMMISRYLLILQLPLFIIILKYYKYVSYIYGIILCFILSIALLYSDTLQTNTYYSIKPSKDNIYFTGEWAFRNVIEKYNGKMLLKNMNSIEENAIVYLPKGHAQYEISKDIIIGLELIKRDSLFDFPIKLYDQKAQAGFFADDGGVLPFSIRKGYSVYYSIYKYKEKNKRYLKYYKEKVELWNNPIIPLNIPQTIQFYNVNNINIELEFFNNINVRKYSDGVNLKVMCRDSVLLEKNIYVDNNDKLYIEGIYDTIVIIIDTLNNSKYDWVGINVK